MSVPYFFLVIVYCDWLINLIIKNGG
jgi:hypothetical protein